MRILYHDFYKSQVIYFWHGLCLCTGPKDKKKDRPGINKPVQLEKKS